MSDPTSTARPHNRWTPPLRAVLATLLEGLDFAEDTGVSPWDYSVPCPTCSNSPAPPTPCAGWWPAATPSTPS